MPNLNVFHCLEHGTSILISQKKDKYLNDFHFKLIFLLFIFMRSISFEHQTGLLSVMGSSSLGLLGSATSFDEFLEDSLIIGGSSTVGT